MLVIALWIVAGITALAMLITAAESDVEGWTAVITMTLHAFVVVTTASAAIKLAELS